jgi:PAS domain S-box-containing protein
MFDFSLDVICAIDGKGKFVEVSAAARYVWGYEPQELIGQPYIELVVDEDREQTTAAAEKIMSGLDMTHFENRYQRKDGSLVLMVWSAHWNASENIMFCIARDASQQKAAEKLQHRYESEIRHQHKQMQDMLERITDGFYAMDASFTFTYWNRQAEVILGRKRSEVVGRKLLELYPDIKDTLFESNYIKALTKQVSVRFEAFFEPLNSWYEVEAHPSQEGLSVFFRDVTERKQEEERRKAYEKQIKARNRQLVDILESTKDGFIAINRTWNITYWNRQAEAILGKSSNEAVGHNLWEILPQEAKGGSFYTECHRAMEQKVIIEYENYAPYYNIWFENRIYPSQEGLYIYFQNINDRKRAETELQRLSLVAKETENAVVFVNPDRVTTWVNPAFTRMTGYTFDEIVGKIPASLLEGTDSDPATSAYIMEQYKKEKPFQVEVLNYKKSGEPFWSELYIQPLFDENGKLEQFFSLRKDITNRKALEAELEEQQKKTTAAIIVAQEAERAQVGLELHDNINQVLTTTKLYMELCRDGIGDTAEIMERCIRLTQDTINEIRSLSKRLSAPSLGNIRLQDSVKELTEAFAATGRLIVSLDLDETGDGDVSSETHLAVYRILQEHMTNVLKHAKANNVKVLLSITRTSLLLKVTDDGAGFDLQQKRQGIGITNMITRAETAKGWLTLNSAPGCGCELVVTIPL